MSLDPARLARIERWRQHWNDLGAKPSERQARLVREAFRDGTSAPR